MLFTHSLEARRLRSKSQHSQVLTRGFLLNCTWPPSHFPGSSAGKESSCKAEDPNSIPRSGRSPEGGHGNPLQYSCLENPHGQRSLAGDSPWDRKESDKTERLSTAQHSTFSLCVHMTLSLCELIHFYLFL